MNSQYNFSYSGSDVKALIKNTYMNAEYKVLNTLTTVSFSVNEQKSPVRRLGRRHVVGFTKAIRTIAGTMVLTVLKGHPLTEFYTLDQYYKSGEMGQGVHRDNSYHFATNVPPFDLRLIYQTEHNSNYYAQLEILGIEIISQSIVTSVNDMITECVLQFVARDYKEFINHVSSVTEDKVRENRAKLQLQDIEKRKETEVIDQNLRGNENNVTPADLQTLKDFLKSIENKKIELTEDVKNILSKINDKGNEFFDWIKRVEEQEYKKLYAQSDEFDRLQQYNYSFYNENYVDNVSEEGITNVVLNHKADPKKKYTLEQINYLLRGANMKSKPKVETVNNNEQLNGLTNAEQNVFENVFERYNKQNKMGVE